MSRTPGPWQHVPPPVRRSLLPAAGAVTLGVVLAVVGASPPHAIGLVAVLLSAVVLRAALTSIDDPRWPALPDHGRDGARRDVSDLGWAIVGRDGRVSLRAARRVRALAVRRLADRGTHPGRPDAEHHLSRDTLGGLHRLVRDGARPTVHELETWLTELERLDELPHAPARHAPAARSDEGTAP